MVIWGAIWGAILGLVWPGGDEEFNMVAGAVLGVIAGLTLRRAVRTEVRKQTEALRAATPAAVATPAAAGAVPVAAPSPAADTAAPVPEPVREEDFQDTFPAIPEPAAARVEAAAPAVARAPALPPEPARPDPVTLLVGNFRDWLFGGNTVVRMGVLVLFIGLAFLAKYAVENSLLPPELRLAAIGAAGIGLFVAGFRLRRKDPDKLGYVLTLQGAGVAVLYLTVFAAFRLYQFLPAGASFALLGLICAFSAAIAIAQNAQSMAFIGFAGAFAAPILVSTGQGNHVGLFSYYTLLGVAIAAIAWLRAWRALNLLGFFATFGIATLWGALKYQPEHLASTQPFLIAFFLIYLAASLMYALRHSHAPKQAVDATLIFGTPIVAFTLQAALMRETEYGAAFSALVLGALYLGLGSWLVKRTRGEPLVNRWLAECFLALGLGFVTLAVPLALDGRWTSAVWAIEGAGVYWMGRRQGRWLPRAAGLVLQAMAAVLFLDSLNLAAMGTLPFGNPQFVGATMLALAALGIAWWSRERLDEAGMSPAAKGFHGLESVLSPVFFWVGFLWWQFALHGEIDRATVDPNGQWLQVFDSAARANLKLVAWVGMAFAFHHLALPARKLPWTIAATPAWTVMPLMLLAALGGMAMHDHVFQSGGWVAWPLALILHFTMLRRLDGGRPVRWWPWVHAGGVWLVVLLAGNLLVFAIGKAQLWQTAWATVILLVSSTVVMLALARKGAYAVIGDEARWPFGRFASAYLWRAALPLAVLLTLGALLVAVHSDGNAKPLPYVPLLNPTDLSVALALGAVALWLVRLRASPLPLPHWAHGKFPIGALAVVAFVAINTVWLRVAHHWAGVPWDADALFDSFLVQAGYSILWTLIALVLMVVSNRRGLRAGWMLGAGLLGLTVLKLFVIDLSNRGGTERIFVFIAVGLLMLVVGWFAPLPPAAGKAPRDADLKEAQT
jgi:uncharacterized membrane protein